MYTFTKLVSSLSLSFCLTLALIFRKIKFHSKYSPRSNTQNRMSEIPKNSNPNHEESTNSIAYRIHAVHRKFVCGNLLGKQEMDKVVFRFKTDIDNNQSIIIIIIFNKLWHTYAECKLQTVYIQFIRKTFYFTLIRIESDCPRPTGSKPLANH